MRIPSIPVGDPVDIWLVTHPSLRQNGVVRSLIRILAGAIRKDAGLFGWIEQVTVNDVSYCDPICTCCGDVFAPAPPTRGHGWSRRAVEA